MSEYRGITSNDFDKINLKTLRTKTIMSVSSIPVASEDLLGNRILYNGKQYKCLTDGSIYFWSEVANGIIKVDDNLPTDNIIDTAVYCLDEMTFIYNDVSYGNLSISAYKREGNVLTIDENGITQGETLTPWESIDTTLINSYISSNWLSMITTPPREWTDAIKGTIEIMSPSDGSFYGWVGNWHLSRVFSYYAHTEEGWLLLASSSQSVPYPSLSQLPTLNGETILGDKTSADYKISRLMTEEEYNNLTESEKMNGTTYMVIASSTGAVNVDTRSYNNLTNKISINGIILQEGMTSADLDFYTRGQVDAKLSGVFHLKGVVDSLSSLPSTANNGDVYYVTSESGSYAYGDSGWQSLGNAIDLSAYQTKDDSALATSSKNIVGAINELNVNKQDKSNLDTSFASTPTNNTYPSSKLVSDSLLLKEDKSNKTTTIDANSTNDQYPSAKATFDYSITQGYYIYKGMKRVAISISDCVFNLDSEFGTSQPESTQIICSKMFPYVNFTDPIANASRQGQCETIEKIYVNPDSCNIYVEQTWTMNQSSNKDSFIIFKRKGYITGVTVANLQTDIVNIIKGNSFTWKNWYPVEYPRVQLDSIINTTAFPVGNVNLSISGGVAIFDFYHLKPASTGIQDIITATNFIKYSSLYKFNARGILGNASSSKGGILILESDRNMSLRCNKADTANEYYNGQMLVTLGY